MRGAYSSDVISCNFSHVSNPVVLDLRTTAGRSLGVGDRAPRLGWATAGAVSVAAHRVQVARDAAFAEVVADTGEQEARGTWVAWPGAPLASRERVHWRVQVHTEHGWTDWASSFVEAGLDPGDWVARPITWAEDPGTQAPGPSPRFATTVELASPPVRARLYVTALGVVEASINGAAVSDEVFAPGWSSYGTRLAYDTYDVTALLRQGSNELSALLGDGWFRGSLLWGESRHRCHYGDRLALLAQLEITEPDGARRVVSTGPDGWTVTDSEVRSSDIYDGCAIDLTRAREKGTVEVLEVDLRERLFARQGPPVRRTEVLASADSWDGVHDFGQNLAGWVRLTVRAGEGQRITLRHAEVLDGKGLLTTPLRTAKATDTWVLSEGEHTLEPRFTFHGFRYAEVVTDAEVLAVEAVAVHSDLVPTASFGCSDARVEQLHRNVVWGQRGNFLSVPTDCPQRDERLGWTGDAQVFAATAGMLHDCRGFFADWLADLRVEQHEDGRVPVVVPDVLREATAIAGWSDAAVVVPWVVAERSGDVELLRASIPSMRAWVDWVDGQRSEGLWLADLQLGDWLDPDAPAGDPWASKADRKLVANAVFAHSARLLAWSLELCGEDGTPYVELADDVAQNAWNRWGSEARTTQTGCALSLRFDLVPAAERVDVAQALADLVTANGGRIGTGFLGTPEVLFALSDNGQVDAAYQLLLCDQCPSWLYQVDRGATTMWERWDAVRPDGSVNLGQKDEADPGMLSFNHYAYGAVAAWLHEVVAGLAVREVPVRTLTVAPRPGGGLTEARATLTTPGGEAAVAWRIDGDRLVIEAVVPPGYEARFDPPPGWHGSEESVPPGPHTWRLSRR
jgi:alpha-L-rhamnosidase